MPDWTRSMKQTYEYYTVDPGTWGDKSRIMDVESCSIVRDLDVDTKGSASIKCQTDLSDEYVRVYLITEQDGILERTPLGTHIYQTPSESFDGKRSSMDQDGYTPLIELSENPPDLGYAILPGVNILKIAGQLTDLHTRAPVVPNSFTENLEDSFVSETGDTWLTFISDLIDIPGFYFDLDERGRIIFVPEVEVEYMTPIWTYTDDNSSILLPDLEIERDLYSIPNVVEVVYSPQSGEDPIIALAVNDDPGSITSTVSRGREITYRETDPNVTEGVNQAQLEEYARQLLKKKSSLEYKVSYSHGYCPVRIGDCVLLDYKRAGLDRVKAKVIRQTIKCESGCTVDEVAVFTKALWG